MISYFIFGSTWIFCWFWLCFLHKIMMVTWSLAWTIWELQAQLGGFPRHPRPAIRPDRLSQLLFFFVESSMFAWSAYFNNNTTFCLKLSKPSSFEIFVYYEHNFIRHLQMLGVRNGENVAKPHILSAFIFVISHAIVLMSKMLSNATKLRWKTVRARIV